MSNSAALRPIPKPPTPLILQPPQALSFSDALRIYSYFFSTQDEDFVHSYEKIKLRDPIGMTLMKLPCRGIACEHLQCFDHALYIHVNRGKVTRYISVPVSYASTPFPSPYLSPTCFFYTNFVLASTVNSSVPSAVNSATLASCLWTRSSPVFCECGLTKNGWPSTPTVRVASFVQLPSFNIHTLRTPAPGE